MKQYLLGEPLFGFEVNDRFSAPAGQQVGLCQGVFADSLSMEVARRGFIAEHTAILAVLAEMGQPVNLAHAYPELSMPGIIEGYREQLGLTIVELKRLPPNYTAFPRDISVRVRDKWLVSHDCLRDLRLQPKPETGVIPSIFGEGGRVLFTGRLAVCSERICSPTGKSLPTGNHEFLTLRRAGLKQVMQLPPFRLVEWGKPGTPTAGVKLVGVNDHMDRIGTLLTGKDGRAHFIVDPTVQFAHYTRLDDLDPDRSLTGEESERVVAERCRVYGVVHHSAPRTMRVPYSLNMHQFEDGRVAMTQGEPELEALVGELVGQDNVFTTMVPIRTYPAWRFGGIRCLLGDMPPPILIRNIQGPS